LHCLVLCCHYFTFCVCFQVYHNNSNNNSNHYGESNAYCFENSREAVRLSDKHTLKIRHRIGNSRS
jgi:hypothetical protein